MVARSSPKPSKTKSNPHRRGKKRMGCGIRKEKSTTKQQQSHDQPIQVPFTSNLFSDLCKYIIEHSPTKQYKINSIDDFHVNVTQQHHESLPSDTTEQPIITLEDDTMLDDSINHDENLYGNDEEGNNNDEGKSLQKEGKKVTRK